ncbi:hypothetical protein SPFM20_00002 [Salmonella phage SPFM20]|nr:hypothetical protein SPFM8_00296 [Salmonella phage SPFM8]VFR14494.1 hypothetical protein SPFM20_00002 [Salmonella phage SPFM20]
MRESEALKMGANAVRAVEIASECDIYRSEATPPLATGSGYEYALGAILASGKAIVGGKREDDVTLWYKGLTQSSQLPAKMDFTFLMLSGDITGQLALLETVRLRPGFICPSDEEWWITGERIVAFGAADGQLTRGSNICNLNTQKL